jgi:hypothetical protein
MIAFRASNGLEITVDDSDWPMVRRYTWSTMTVPGSKTKYARATVDGQTVLLHRFLLQPAPEEEVNHRDGDGLNNVRANLRIVPHSIIIQNAWTLPGRYGNPTTGDYPRRVPTEEELDRELEEWMAAKEYRAET